MVAAHAATILFVRFVMGCLDFSNHGVQAQSGGTAELERAHGGLVEFCATDVQTGSRALRRAAMHHEALRCIMLTMVRRCASYRASAGMKIASTSRASSVSCPSRDISAIVVLSSAM